MLILLFVYRFIGGFFAFFFDYACFLSDYDVLVLFGDGRSHALVTPQECSAQTKMFPFLPKAEFQQK